MINHFHESLLRIVPIRNATQEHLSDFFETLLDENIISHDIYLRLESTLEDVVTNSYEDGQRDETIMQQTKDEIKKDVSTQLSDLLSNSIPDNKAQPLKKSKAQYSKLYWSIKNYIVNDL
jgi:hypothetical protein